jgi:hypothetical protein
VNVAGTKKRPINVDLLLLPAEHSHLALRKQCPMYFQFAQKQKCTVLNKQPTGAPHACILRDPFYLPAPCNSATLSGTSKVPIFLLLLSTTPNRKV